MTSASGLLPKVAVFAVAAVVGGSATFVGAAALTREGPVSSAADVPEYEGTADTPSGDAVPVAFDLRENGQEPTIVQGLAPAELAAVTTALTDVKPASWLSSGLPRGLFKSQWDGGPFQSTNCTMAAGAMLAHMAFGIDQTPSTFRSLQYDFEGGTGIDDFLVALHRGFGVTVSSGLITMPTLRNLLANGNGVMLQIVYGEIAEGVRLQPDFVEPHAIYIDAIHPGIGAIPPAYYVMDPLGLQGAYDGEWWEAEMVERAARAFGVGGRAFAAWAKPEGGPIPTFEGIVPDISFIPDVQPLPPSGGEISGPPPVAPSPSPATGSPGPASPSPEVSPSIEPGLEEPPYDAGTDPPDLTLPDSTVDTPARFGGLDMVGSLIVCLANPPPPGCPGGVPGVFRRPFGALIPVLGPAITIEFIDSGAPNVALVGFRVDPLRPATVRYWKATGSPTMVMTASSQTSLELLGDTMIVARLDVLAATTYHFQVVAGVSATPVGTFTTVSGVRLFDTLLVTEDRPVFDVGVGTGPYVHLEPGGFSPPMVPIGPSDPCTDVATFGETAYCLETAAGSGDAGCRTITVDYALEGIHASGVLVRAFPTTQGTLPDGSLTLRGVTEAEGPAGAGQVEIGCLASGLAYNLVIDAINDERGELMTRLVTIP